MGNARPVPAQRSLFPPEPADLESVLAWLKRCTGDELDRVLRAGSFEMLRRCRRAVPVAAPVAQATYQMMSQELGVRS
jgi:hypothetical protein